MVSTRASEVGFSNGRLATEEKSYEITAILNLLEVIDLEDIVVTIDVMGSG